MAGGRPRSRRRGRRPRGRRSAARRAPRPPPRPRRRGAPALRPHPGLSPYADTVEAAQPVRPAQTTAFDFAFDFDSLGAPALFPTGAINLGVLSGLQRSPMTFDAIKLAPPGGYVFDKPLVLDTGTVVLVRSRPTLCAFGTTVSLYAKLRVLGVDSTARRLDFEILADQNCGYRGLEPGLPKQ